MQCRVAAAAAICLPWCTAYNKFSQKSSLRQLEVIRIAQATGRLWAPFVNINLAVSNYPNYIKWENQRYSRKN